MGKIIAIVLLVIVGAILFRQWGRKLRDKMVDDDEPSTDTSSRPPASQPPAAAQLMVTCAHCGVHLPQCDALTTHTGDAGAPGLYYCSPEHRERHTAGHPSA